MATTDQAADKPKRDRTLTRTFIHESEPHERGRADLDVTAVQFKYANGKSTRFDLAAAFPGGQLPSPCVARAAAAFGINTSAGNAGNTIDSVDADDIREAVEERLGLFEKGKWSQERQGGGTRTTYLLEAAIEYRKANGRPVDEASMEKIEAAFDDKETVKTWMAVPEFAKIYYRIQYEKRIAGSESKKGGDASALLG